MKENSEFFVVERHDDSSSSKPVSLDAGSAKAPSIKNRLGVISAWLFFGSTVVVSNLVAFLSYLWYSDENNHPWRTIVVENWMTRCVSFTSTAIRFCTTTQTALCLSMLAAIALEKYYIPHSEVAAVSMMRIGGSSALNTVKNFIYPMASRGPRWSFSFIMVLLATTVLLFTSTVLQFTSTLLLSDMKSFMIPDFQVESLSVPYDYGWLYDAEDNKGHYLYKMVDSALAWGNNKPLVHPSFAEYTDASTVVQQTGVSDTGTTTRAFLPISDSVARGEVRNYTGKALVLDARVTCVLPKLVDASWVQLEDNSWYLQGNVSASVDLAHVNSASDPLAFTCLETNYVKDPQFISLCELYNDGQYGVSVTQPNAGGLVSAFRNSTANDTGAAYLVLSPAAQYTSEWLNLTAPLASGKAQDVAVYVTLCYAALDVADRDINAFSDSNRTELILDSSRGAGTSGYDFAPLVAQMLPGQNVEERGILSLNLAEGESWVHELSSANSSDGPIEIPAQNYEGYSYENDLPYLPYLVNTLHLRPYYGNVASRYPGIGNMNVVLDAEEFANDLYTIGAQDWVGDLFNVFLTEENGGTSKALQTILTVLASTHYYDRLPVYDKETAINTTSFGLHTAPRGPYAWNYQASLKARSHYYMHDFHYSWTHNVAPFLTLVLAILLVHHINVFCIFFWFMNSSRLSRLGDPWQAVAHVVAGDETSRVVELSRRMGANRSVAYDEMESAGLSKVCVGLSGDENGTVVLQRH